jgi:hypothetical protein
MVLYHPQPVHVLLDPAAPQLLSPQCIGAFQRMDPVCTCPAILFTPTMQTEQPARY